MHGETVKKTLCVFVIKRHFQLPILHSVGDTKERTWRKNRGMIIQEKKSF